jgi:septal ring factor EnvC (AmiA/AmiB activator)
MALSRFSVSLAMVLALALAGESPGQQPTEQLEDLRHDLEQQASLEEERAERMRRLLDEIRSLDARLLGSSRNLAGLETEDEAVEVEYASHQGRLDMLETEYAKSRALLAARLSSIYKRGRLGNSRALLQTATSTEPLRMARYLAAISKADASVFTDYEAVRRKHRAALAELAEKKADVDAKKAAIEQEQARYESARSAKQALVASLEHDQAAGRSEQKRLKAAESDLERILAETAAAVPPSPPKEIARAEPVSPAERRARSSPVRRILGSRGRGEAVELPFAELKGKLRPPVHGAVLARFGDARETGPPSQGVLVRSAKDFQVTAVGSGEVVFSGPFPGLGKTLIINHGGRYHSVYAHLDVIQHEVGGHVRTNEVIGTVAKSEPILHFELRAEGKALDPAPWLEGGYEAFSDSN